MNREKRSVVNTGTVSMLVIFIGVCLAVLAALSLSGARNDYNLSKKMAEHTSQYYAALNQAEAMLMNIEELKEKHSGENPIRFQVAMNETQALEVVIRLTEAREEYELESCQVINTDTWEGEDFLPVWQ